MVTDASSADTGNAMTHNRATRKTCRCLFIIMNIKKIIIVGTTKVDKLSKKHKQYTKYVKRNRKKNTPFEHFLRQKG